MSYCLLSEGRLTSAAELYALLQGRTTATSAQKAPLSAWALGKKTKHYPGDNRLTSAPGLRGPPGDPNDGALARVGAPPHEPQLLGLLLRVGTEVHSLHLHKERRIRSRGCLLVGECTPCTCGREERRRDCGVSRRKFGVSRLLRSSADTVCRQRTSLPAATLRGVDQQGLSSIDPNCAWSLCRSVRWLSGRLPEPMPSATDSPCPLQGRRQTEPDCRMCFSRVHRPTFPPTEPSPPHPSENFELDGLRAHLLLPGAAHPSSNTARDEPPCFLPGSPLAVWNA